jgi:hypothetical protein
MAYYFGAIDLKTAGGTDPAVGATGPAGPATPMVRPSPIEAWLATLQARQFAGRWVLLNEDLEPVDADLSPTALQNRHANSGGGDVIVFVQPGTAQFDA